MGNLRFLKPPVGRSPTSWGPDKPCRAGHRGVLGSATRPTQPAVSHGLCLLAFTFANLSH